MIDSHLPKVIRMERFEIVHKSIPEIQSNNCNFCEQLEKITDEGMEEYGNPYLVSVLKKNCLSPAILKLKIGAVVMFTRNNFDVGYVNGTLGKIVSYSGDGFPIVEIKGKQKASK